jgi:hypothetical protein
VRRVHLILLVALATMAVSVVGASSAVAAGGPLWLVKGETYDCEQVAGGTGEFNTLLECLGGLAESGSLEWKLKTLANHNGSLELDEGALILALNLGSFKLKAGNVATITCTALHAVGSVVGGIPGKNHEVITFTGCTVGTLSNCDVRSIEGGVLTPIGTVVMKSRTELVLRTLASKANNLAVLFEPEHGGGAFTTLKLESLGALGCLGFAGEQAVTGSVASIFEPSDESSVEEGMLTFPTEPISKAFRWNPNTGEHEEIKIGLKEFGTTVEQLGLADVILKDGGLLGAHCGGCSK